jgi:TRAP-type C4-dicarboxylate transport system permease large subunit
VVVKICLIALVMVLTYAIAKRKLSVEVSMLLTAVSGVVAGGIFGTPPLTQAARHLVEGAFTYLDVVLIFLAATIFMEIVRSSGTIDYLVRGILRRFHNHRLIILLLLLVVILIPGALTGAGSVSLLVVGAPIAMALGYLGISTRRIAAILFITAGLSAVAPPVNIWCMITCAGTAIPYVGFDLPLLLPVLLVGVFTMLVLGWRGEPAPLETVLQEMGESPKGMSWWRVTLPFAALFGMILAGRFLPFHTPLLGLPLQFVIAAVIAWIVSPLKVRIVEVCSSTLHRLVPLLATVLIVGMLQQVMTATGVRGMLSYAVISIPIGILFMLLAVIIPVSEGILTYGGAAVFGIPLIWFFDSIGLHATVALAGLSLLWPLGDGLPPTALIGRLSVMVSGYKGSYWSFLRATWAPWVLSTILGILMVVFSSRLGFLV